MFEAGLTGADEPTVSMLVTAAMAPSSDGAASKRSPGELRRRRWADARKKGRVVEAELTALLGSPVRVDCIDCAQDGTERVEGSLRSASCVWVTGGNTFFLWHHMRMSGAAALIADRVGDGCLYVGQSAGAIVAGYSIETAFWKGWDDPQAASDASWTTETLGASRTRALEKLRASVHALGRQQLDSRVPSCPGAVSGHSRTPPL
jgi:hypothetical protein